MGVFHSASIISILCMGLFAPLDAYPRIRISKHANIYRQIERTIQLQETEELFADSSVCQTTACQSAGKAFKENLNTSVDPCDDFYEFACGGWVASHTIPDDKSTTFSDENIDKEIMKKINDSLQEPRGPADAQAIVYAAELYRSCLDNATRESVGVAPLKKLLDDTLGGWPIASGAFNEKDFEWKDSLSTLAAELGMTSIFTFGISPDENDTLVRRFQFSAANPGPLLQEKEEPEIAARYRNLILRSAMILGAKNDSQTNGQIDEMMAFERHIVNISIPLMELPSAKVWYNRMSFNEFNKLVDNKVDWVKLLNNVYIKLKSPVRVNGNDLVIVSALDYFKEITKVIDKMPKRALANHFGWVVVSSFGGLTNQAFRTAMFEWSKARSGVLKDSPFWEHCIHTVDSALEYAVGRLYIDKSFSPKDKEVASVMVNDIRESFDELIKSTDFLDTTTRGKALNKLHAIHQNVGYPDWVLNNTQLNHYYNLTKKADPKKFFENRVYLWKLSNADDFNSLREPINMNTSWPMPPQILNAAYDPTQNSITIPAGILNSPYFNGQLPAHVNYGAIGVVVGHELTHGFDNQGSKFDANGNFRNWWTESVSEKFKQKTECFIEEYNNIEDLQTKVHLNGNNTVGENIADNGGVREAYNAYLKYVKRHGQTQRLPLISQYSAEQQFFISYANCWCTKYRTEYLKQIIHYEAHSPGKYRVNVPLSNFQTFSDVFKCSEKSAMNRKNRCIMW